MFNARNVKRDLRQLSRIGNCGFCCGTLSGKTREMTSIPFSGNPLDRASDRRGDSGWLQAQAAAGLYLPFWQNRPFITEDRVKFLPWRSEWEGQTDRDHRAILAALRRSDIESAADILSRHVRWVGRRQITSQTGTTREAFAITG